MTKAVALFKKLVVPLLPKNVREVIAKARTTDVTGVMFKAALLLRTKLS